MRENHGIRELCLLCIAATFRRLPNFRGKVRVLMELHKLLGLENKHFAVSTTLHHPVRFRANLDLFCKHERMAFFMDRYEPGTVEFLARLWEPGEIFLDVGANIGLIAIPFTLISGESRKAQREPNRKLTYCIEAVDANFESLKTNIQLNSLGTQIEVLRAAVGEREKDVEIQVEKNQKSEEGTGTANILAENSDYQCERIPLHVTTIDHLVADGKLPRNCGLMKIDTDGYDLFILMGAKSFLKETRPIIYGEFNAHCLNWHGQTIYDVQRYLASLGFRVFTRENGWSFAPLVEGVSFKTDSLCVPVEKVDRVRWCVS